MDLAWDQPPGYAHTTKSRPPSCLATRGDTVPLRASLPPGAGRACLEDVEANGMALGVLAVLAQSDADAAGAWALGD